MIETWGFTPAVEAADTGMKTANVRLLACELTRPALMTVAFTGDVAAVRTAVDAGAHAAARVGRVVSAHVIARPATSLIDHFAPKPSSPPFPAVPNQASGRGPAKGGPTRPEETKATVPVAPEEKAPPPSKALASPTPAVPGQDPSGSGDGDKKVIPAKPQTENKTAIEPSGKVQPSSGSKPAAASKQVPKKKLKSAAKPKAPKAHRKKTPPKAPA